MTSVKLPEGIVFPANGWEIGTDRPPVDRANRIEQFHLQGQHDQQSHAGGRAKAKGGFVNDGFDGRRSKLPPGYWNEGEGYARDTIIDGETVMETVQMATPPTVELTRTEVTSEFEQQYNDETWTEELTEVTWTSADGKVKIVAPSLEDFEYALQDGDAPGYGPEEYGGPVDEEGFVQMVAGHAEMARAAAGLDDVTVRFANYIPPDKQMTSGWVNIDEPGVVNLVLSKRQRSVEDNARLRPADSDAMMMSQTLAHDIGFTTVHEIAHVAQVRSGRLTQDNLNDRRIIPSDSFSPWEIDGGNVNSDWMSDYGRTAWWEAEAEAFSEWVMTAGTSSNPAVQAYARQVGWEDFDYADDIYFYDPLAASAAFPDRAVILEGFDVPGVLVDGAVTWLSQGPPLTEQFHLQGQHDQQAHAGGRAKKGDSAWRERDEWWTQTADGQPVSWAEYSAAKALANYADSIERDRKRLIGGYYDEFDRELLNAPIEAQERLRDLQRNTRGQDTLDALDQMYEPAGPPTAEELAETVSKVHEMEKNMPDHIGDPNQPQPLRTGAPDATQRRLEMYQGSRTDRVVAKAVEDWSGSFDSTREMRDRLEAGDPEMELFRTAIRSSPPTTEPLYRGMRYGANLEAWQAVQPGSVVSLDDIGSFTENPEHSRLFGEQVRIELLPGAAALPISSISNTPAEREWLLAGDKADTHTRHRGAVNITNVEFVTPEPSPGGFPPLEALEPNIRVQARYVGDADTVDIYNRSDTMTASASKNEALDLIAETLKTPLHQQTPDPAAPVQVFHLQGQHDQQDHAGKRARRVADSTGSLAEPDSGFTRDAGTLRPVETGWAVALGGTDKLVAGPEAFDRNGRPTPRIKRMLVDRIDAAMSTAVPEGTKRAVGAWHNPDDGKIEINVTAVFPSDQYDAAFSFAQAEDQISMANLDAITAGDWDNAIVNTGGTGGAREVEDD